MTSNDCNIYVGNSKSCDYRIQQFCVKHHFDSWLQEEHDKLSTMHSNLLARLRFDVRMAVAMKICISQNVFGQIGTVLEERGAIIFRDK